MLGGGMRQTGVLAAAGIIAIVGEPDGSVVRFLTNNDVDEESCRHLVELLAEFRAR